MKEVLSSSETSVLTRATWRNTPEDTLLHFTFTVRHLEFTRTQIFPCSPVKIFPQGIKGSIMKKLFKAYFKLLAALDKFLKILW
jgi:hypothetical protein